MQKVSKIVLHITRILIVICEAIFLLVTFLPYQTLKTIGNLLSPDRDLQSFTPKIAHSLKSPALVAGILLAALGVFLFLIPRKSQTAIEAILNHILEFFAGLKKDTQLFFTDIWDSLPGKLESLLLAILIIISAIPRLLLINRPIEYDEAFTFTEFARISFHYIITSYFVPNNQVFHTILVRFAYIIFGDHLWAIRLPTFLASLILILVVYFLGRSLYNRKVGWIAAVVVAFLPGMVLHSVSARGYVIVTLASYAGFLAANYAIRKKNILAWVSLIVFCAIGFYTIPVMLFPCGMLFAWMLVVGISGETRQEYGKLVNWLKYLFFAGISIGVLVLILYSPILLTNNLSQIYVNNRVLQPASLPAFIRSIPVLLQTIELDWSEGLTVPFMALIMIGLILSFLFYKKESRYRFPMQIVFIVYTVVIGLIERPAYPIARIWLWVLPLIALWFAVGLVGGMEWISRKLSIGYITKPALALILLVFTAVGIFQAYDMSVLHPVSEDPVAGKITLFLRPLLTEDDLVTVSQCSDARYWYYFQHYGIPEKVIRDRDRYFSRDYVIVYTQANPSCGNEVMTKVFSTYGPDAAFFDKSKIRVVKQFDYATIYEMDPIPERIQKAYPRQ